MKKGAHFTNFTNILSNLFIQQYSLASTFKIDMLLRTLWDNRFTSPVKVSRLRQDIPPMVVQPEKIDFRRFV